jgi:type IV pilus assembly protein PilY1
MTVSSGSNIAVGSTVTGSGVLSGTSVVAQVSGASGGAGTYTVNQPQLVTSEAMGIGSTTLTISAGQGLAVGQTLSGPGVVSGTQIASQVSGYTGGPGVYTVSKSQSLGTVGFNVLNSGNSGTAGIFITLVDPSNEGMTTYFLDTGYGPAQDPLGQHRPNGIAYASPVDLDGDNTVDYIYAGDLFGNIWRFDVTSSNPANWSVSTFGAASPAPLFSVNTSLFSSGQPITARPLVVMTPQSNGNTAVMVIFGTGQENAVTPVSPTTYATGQQALYGIWDWDMAAWNTLAHASLASLSETAVRSYLGGAITASNLATQSTTVVTIAGGTSEEVVSANPVCWYGVTPLAAGCGTGTQFGWTLPFGGGTGEQLIYNPTYWQGVLQVNTVVPSPSTVFSCNIIGSSGWTMFLNPANGGAFTSSSFLDTNGNPMVTSGGSVVSGLQLNVAGSLTNFNNGTSNYYVGGVQSQGAGSGSNSQGVGGAEKGQGAGAGHRVTWTQLR